MKKNEVTTTTNNAIEKKQNVYINRYNKVVEKCNRTAWELAKVVYETVNSEDFKDVFGTQTEYAKKLGVSNSALSKFVDAYERKLILLENNPEFEKMNRSNVEEMTTIETEDMHNFITWEDVQPTDSVKVIREKVKHFKNGELEETKETEETEETEDCEESENDLMILTYKGIEYQIITEEMIEKIKTLLEIE